MPKSVVIDQKVDEFVSAVQAHVDYCLTCQPYEDGDAIWILGEEIDFEHLMEELDIPEDLRDEVARRIICPNCGAGQERYNRIGRKDEFEIEADRKWEEWHCKVGFEVNEFASYLADFSYLGLSHSMGQRIFDSLVTFPCRDMEDEVWWRARRPDGGRKFSASEMHANPAPMSEGRFSHYGQSALYIASDPAAAAAECLGPGDEIAWVKQFKVRSVKKVLDLSDYLNAQDAIDVLSLGLINEHLDRLTPDEKSPWKPEYFLPRFIADCARQQGYGGIIFRSRRHYGTNLVIFSYDKSMVRAIGKTKLFQFEEPLPADRARYFDDRMPF